MIKYQLKVTKYYIFEMLLANQNQLKQNLYWADTTNIQTAAEINSAFQMVSICRICRQYSAMAELHNMEYEEL